MDTKIAKKALTAVNNARFLTVKRTKDGGCIITTIRKRPETNWQKVYDRAVADCKFYTNSTLHCVLWTLAKSSVGNHFSITVEEMATLIHKKYGKFTDKQMELEYYPNVYQSVRNAMIKACKLAKVPFNGRILVSMPV